MSNDINTKKLPSSDWDDLEKKKLWERNAAAKWFVPTATDLDRILVTMSTVKRFDAISNKQLGRLPENQIGENLKHLRGFGKLKKLAAPRTLKDEGFEYICQLGKLTTLYLRGNQFTNIGLAHLSNLTKLKTLTTEFLPAGPEALSIIAKLPSLKYLGMVESDVTDDDLIPLIDSKITNINLAKKNLTGECLKHLGQITTLEELMIGQINVTDDQLKYISGLTNLKRLTLSRTQITINGLKHLECLTSLKKLQLEKNMCKTAEAKALKKLIPGLVIKHNA